MVISSRTPEGEANSCPVCGSDVKVEPSDPAGDAPCPRCGHLLWFSWFDLGDVQVIKPRGNEFGSDPWDALASALRLRPGMQLAIDLGEVEWISSSALGKLIALRKQVQAVRGCLRLRNVSAPLAEVFRITRLDLVFIVED